MQNQILKYDITDNTVDNDVIINPTKQQLVFFPKEESQMFQGKSFDFSVDTDKTTITENNDMLAFVNRIKDESTSMPIDPLGYGLPGTTGVGVDDYYHRNERINSSHTPTDYIGASSISVPTILNENFCDFKLINGNSEEELYVNTTTSLDIITPGIQRVKIPQNRFNTILTNSTDIINNGGDNLIRNYGKYYIKIAPKGIEIQVVDLERHHHQPWESMRDNVDITMDGPNAFFNPLKKRRSVVYCDKSDFLNSLWNFESSSNQSGRLYGSIVEIWDSSLTELKQTKVITENIFDFNNDTTNYSKLVLQPDIIGYDTMSQALVAGDFLRIYPRETYFNQIILEINYLDKLKEINSLVRFMLNDVVRDMETGIVEIYDDNGLSIDSNGSFNGTVSQRYQIQQEGKFELRKKLK